MKLLLIWIRALCLQLWVPIIATGTFGLVLVFSYVVTNGWDQSNLADVRLLVISFLCIPLILYVIGHGIAITHGSDLGKYSLRSAYVSALVSLLSLILTFQDVEFLIDQIDEDAPWVIVLIGILSLVLHRAYVSFHSRSPYWVPSGASLVFALLFCGGYLLTNSWDLDYAAEEIRSLGFVVAMIYFSFLIDDCVSRFVETDTQAKRGAGQYVCVFVTTSWLVVSFSIDGFDTDLFDVEFASSALVFGMVATAVYWSVVVIAQRLAGGLFDTSEERLACSSENKVVEDLVSIMQARSKRLHYLSRITLTLIVLTLSAGVYIFFVADSLAQSQQAREQEVLKYAELAGACLLYTSPSPRDLSTSRMPSSA